VELDQLRAFVCVADAGNYLEAARRSGMARTTLRRRVEALEASFGTSLMARHGHGLTLTPPGRALLGRARALLQDADRLQRELVDHVHDPESRVVINIPIGIHPIAAVTTLAQVRARFPAFRLDVRYRQTPVAELSTDGDLALCWGPRVPDGPWKARRLGTVPIGLLAHRAYAEAHGLPSTLEEIRTHPVFTPSIPGLSASRLPLRDGGTWPVTPTMASDNLLVGWEAARHGMGLALGVTVDLPGDGWDAGDKCTVLREEVGYDLPFWLVVGHAMRERPALEPLVADIQAVLMSLTMAG